MVRYVFASILFIFLPYSTAETATAPAEKVVSISGNSTSLTLKTRTGAEVSEKTGNDVRIEVTDLQTGRPLPAVLKSGLLIPNSDAQYTVGGLKPSNWYGVLFQSIVVSPVHHVYSEYRIFRTFSANRTGPEPAVVVNITQKITGKGRLEFSAVTEPTHLDYLDTFLSVLLICDRGHMYNKTSGEISLKKQDLRSSDTFQIAYKQNFFGSAQNSSLAATLVPEFCKRVCWDTWLISKLAEVSFFLRKTCSEVPADTVEVPLRKVKEVTVKNRSISVTTDFPVNQTELHSRVTVSLFNLSSDDPYLEGVFMRKSFDPAESWLVEQPEFYNKTAFFGLKYMYNITDMVDYVYEENFAFTLKQRNGSSLLEDRLLQNVSYREGKIQLHFHRPDILKPHQIGTKIFPFCDQEQQEILLSNENPSDTISLEISDKVRETLIMIGAASVDLSEELPENCKEICWQHEIIVQNQNATGGTETFEMEKTCASLEDVLAAIQTSDKFFLRDAAPPVKGYLLMIIFSCIFALSDRGII